jgi:hypothetical protein
VPWGIFCQKRLESGVLKLHSGRFYQKIVQKRENLNKILVKPPTVHTKTPKIGPNLTQLFATLTKTIGFPKKINKKLVFCQILTFHSTVESFPSKILGNVSFSQKKKFNFGQI